MDVSVVPCSAYDLSQCRQALEQLLSPLGGLDWVRPGMRVGLKANLITFLKPDAAGTTHPVVLSALSELLTERGAEVIIGDSPGGLPPILKYVHYADSQLCRTYIIGMA